MDPQYPPWDMLESIIQRWAKEISLDLGEIRDRTEKLVENLLQILERFPKTRHDEDRDPIHFQSFWEKLWKPITLAVLSITPFGKSRAITVPIRGAFEARVVSPHFVLGGALHRIGSDRLEITVRLNAMKAVEDFRSQKQWLIREVYSTLLHEITHAKDFQRPKSYEISERGTPTDPKTYYNDPQEVRAFLQQILDQTRAFVIHTHELLGEDLEADTTLVENALRASLVWDEIKRHLSPQNRKHILRIVGQDVLSQVQKLKARRSSSS